MKQFAQGHRATKWQSRDWFTHPCCAHRCPLRPVHPNVPSQTCSQARLPPSCSCPPSEALWEIDPTSGFRPFGSAPPQCSCSHAPPPGVTRSLGQVLPTLLPRKARLPWRTRFHPTELPSRVQQEAADGRAGSYVRHQCGRCSPHGHEAASRSETCVREPRTVPGLGPN